MDASTTAGSPGDPAVHPAVPPALLGAAAVAAAGAAALVLAERPVSAGVGTAAAGALLVLVLVLVGTRADGTPRLRFVDAALERALDAVVLGAVAWAGLPDRPVVTGAALAALGASYLASYLRAKATGLGFPIPRRVALRGVRWLALSVGLLVPPFLVGALWTVAAISAVRLVAETAAVARRREER